MRVCGQQGTGSCEKPIVPCAMNNESSRLFAAPVADLIALQLHDVPYRPLGTSTDSLAGAGQPPPVGVCLRIVAP
jgi:hypothetical protein